MIALGQTAMRLPAVKELLGGGQCALLREIEQNIDPLEDVARLIGAAIDPDDSTPLKEGGVIRPGYDKPVSYTHLDVYKRQASCCPPRCFLPMRLWPPVGRRSAER